MERVETSAAALRSELKTAHDEIDAWHALSGFVKPEIPPREFENPDASIQLNGKFVSALIASSIPPLIQFSGGLIARDTGSDHGNHLIREHNVAK